MERDEIIESIVSEYDLEAGFIGQLRMRRFDRRARSGYWTRSAGSPSRRTPSTSGWLVTFILFQFSRIGRGRDCPRATSAISMNSSTSCSGSASMLWAHRDLLMIVEGFSEAPGGSGECDRRVRDAAGDHRRKRYSKRSREEDSMGGAGPRSEGLRLDGSRRRVIIGE